MHARVCQQRAASIYSLCNIGDWITNSWITQQLIATQRLLWACHRKNLEMLIGSLENKASLNEFSSSHKFNSLHFVLLLCFVIKNEGSFKDASPNSLAEANTDLHAYTIFYFDVERVAEYGLEKFFLSHLGYWKWMDLEFVIK